MSQHNLPPIPPSTMFLSIEPDPMQCTLLHGTCGLKLERVAAEGLAPRRQHGGESNWEHPSHADAVYLTTAYAMYYGSEALTEADDLVVILDVDYTQLDQALLVADEDSYALTTVKGFEWVSTLPLPERVAFWREHLHGTSPSESLRVLGNCAYLGVIPPQAIRGVRLLTAKEAAVLTMAVADPVIHPTNFKIMGGGFQRFAAWLVGRGRPEDQELAAWYAQVLTPALPVMTLQDAVAYVTAMRESPGA